jgi:AcrR family transcriptional regulator
MPRYKSSNREAALTETRRRLLDAAAEEFAQHGYDGANVNNISLAAGFAKGTIYNYFPSKQALMLALIDHIARLHFDFIAEQVRLEQEPRRRLERFCQAGIDFVGQYPAQARLITTTLYGPDEAFKQHIYQNYRPFFELVAAEILQPGVAQDIFEVTNLPMTASLIMVTYLGCCAQMNDQNQVWLDAGQVADFVLRALRPAKPTRS